MGICQSARQENQNTQEQPADPQISQQPTQPEQKVISDPAVSNGNVESSAINGINTSIKKEGDKNISSVFTFGNSQVCQNSLVLNKENSVANGIENITDSNKLKQTQEIYNKINPQPQVALQGAGNVNPNLLGNIAKPVSKVIRPNVIAQPAPQLAYNTRPVITPIRNQKQIINTQQNVINKNQLYIGPDGKQYIYPNYLPAQNAAVNNKIANNAINYALPQNYNVQNNNVYNKYYY